MASPSSSGRVASPTLSLSRPGDAVAYRQASRIDSSSSQNGVNDGSDLFDASNVFLHRTTQSSVTAPSQHEFLRSCSPELTLQSLDTSREQLRPKRHSFIEASENDDAIVSRHEDAYSSSPNLSFTTGWDAAPGGSVNRNKSAAAGSALGSIGDGRPANSSPEAHRTRALPPVLRDLDRNIPPASAAVDSEQIFTSIAVPKSRPSSFILDVLPADQARDRKAAVSGSPYGMLSVDTAVSPTLSRVPSPARSASSDIGSVGFDFSSARASQTTVSQLTDDVTSAEIPIGNHSHDPRVFNMLSSLSSRVTQLETGLQDLAASQDAEMRAMKKEMNMLRTFVIQASVGSVGHAPESALDRDLSTSPAIGNGRPAQRSPGILAPHPVIASSSVSPLSPMDTLDKDRQDQISLLTAQINALSSTVTHLMSAGVGPAAVQHPATFNQQQRHVSSPVAPQSSSPYAENWRRDMIGISNKTAAVSGLGLTNASHPQTAYSGNASKNAMMRSLSATSMTRGNSLNGSSWDPASSPMVTSGSSLGASSPVPGSNPPGSLGSKWEALGIGADLFRAVAKYGIGPPTKVQMKAIPVVARMQDVIAQAPAIQERIQSYVIPSLQLMLANMVSEHGGSPRGIQTLVITATVDQAAQAHRLYSGLGSAFGIHSALIAGHPSSSDLKGDVANLTKTRPQVLVGTPHKMHELLKVGLNLVDVKMLVVDECDQVLARNLSDHVSSIAKMLADSISGSRSSLGAGSDSSTPSRQTVIFSCTVPQDVLTFAGSLQGREVVRVLARRDTAETASPSSRGVRQYFLPVQSTSKAPGSDRMDLGTAREHKLQALADLCRQNVYETAIVVCASVDSVEAVSYKLNSSGIDSYVLHQDLSSSARSALMSRFRSSGSPRSGGLKKALVVYDALSRNLTDAPPVTLVINFELPRVWEDYQSRVGLASTSGNNGRSAVIVNIVAANAELEMLRNIESHFRCKISEWPAASLSSLH
ncbi:hypothetical protein OIV83_006192 [Microbotryomycetes sp. JL201]|nr:hypothetical protein OIV83_006192 [Microbotryomycetes sp. JL201]